MLHALQIQKNPRFCVCFVLRVCIIILKRLASKTVSKANSSTYFPSRVETFQCPRLMQVLCENESYVQHGCVILPR